MKTHTLSRTSRALAAALLLVAGLAHAAPPPRDSIAELPSLGPRGAIALTLNNRGDVGGYSGWTAPGSTNTYYHAVLWRNGASTDLGAALGTPPGHTYSQVTAINDHGLVAVTGYAGPHLWKDGTWTQLPFDGVIYDIDRSGRLVGSFNNGDATHAYVYRDGLVVDLGTLGGHYSTANAINDKGVVVGASFIAGDQETRAFVWQDGRMTALPTLGGTLGAALDVNSRGVVVGVSRDAAGVSKAFIHDASGLRALSNLPAGNSQAVAIDDRGVVLVVADAGSFLWNDGAVTWLEDLPSVRAAGWSRLFPTDMNDRGDIVGWGWKVGGPVDGLAFVLSVR